MDVVTFGLPRTGTGYVARSFARDFFRSDPIFLLPSGAKRKLLRVPILRKVITKDFERILAKHAPGCYIGNMTSSLAANRRLEGVYLVFDALYLVTGGMLNFYGSDKYATVMDVPLLIRMLMRMEEREIAFAKMLMNIADLVNDGKALFATLAKTNVSHFEYVLRAVGTRIKRGKILPYYPLPKTAAENGTAPRTGILPSGKHKILLVGTEEPRKNTDIVYEAVSNHLPQNYVLVRVGRLSPRTAKYRKRLGGRFIHLSNVDDRTLEGIYKSADVAVFLSFFEGLGLPPLEAVFAGTPVIASDIPPHVDILGNKYPLFVPPEIGAEELAATIKDVVKNREDYSEALHKAREHYHTLWRSSVTNLKEAMSAMF